jgi:hypothetical protein
MAMDDIAEPPDQRIAVSRERLESEITEAVRRLEAGCKGFAGVIIERLEPKSHADPNWAVKGVRFGGADREKAAKVLPTVVERMQREFTLAKNGATIPLTPKQSANNTNPPPTVVERIQPGSAEHETAIPQTPKQLANNTNPPPTVVEGMQPGSAENEAATPQTPKQLANNTNPPPTVVERMQRGSAENDAATPQTPKQSRNDTNPSRVSRKRRRVRSGKALRATDETRSTPAGYVDSPGLAEEG